MWAVVPFVYVFTIAHWCTGRKGFFCINLEQIEIYLSDFQLLPYFFQRLKVDAIDEYSDEE